MRTDHYLEVIDLDRADFTSVLDLSEEVRARPHLGSRILDGEIVFCYFAKPSTRTRVSFAAAVAHLGGQAVFFGSTELQLGRGETIEDTAAVVGRYARAAVVRTFAHDEVVSFARASPIPVINALTDLHHPCQALADVLTIRNRFGGTERLRLAWIGPTTNVLQSLLQASALSGMDVAIAAPEGSEPNAELLDGARALARQTGARVTVSIEPEGAVAGAQVVYTDTWQSMGHEALSPALRQRLAATYRVTEKLMAGAAPEAIFMHCLPAHRGEEVEPAVIDGVRSAVLDQAENRMHTEQALLIALLDGRLEGS